MTAWRLESRSGLTPAQYEDVLRLQADCESEEGLDLKLELEREGNRAAVNTFLAYSGDQVIGYCGISLGHDAEVCGMVHPRRRHQGIGTDMLDSVIARLAASGRQSFLVIGEDASPVCLHWMRRRGASLDQTELRMVLGLARAPSPTTRGTAQLRPAGDANPAELLRLLSGAFLDAEEFVNRPIRAGDDDEETVLAYDGETLIGTTRLVNGSRRSMIYGFVIDRALRGQGRGGLMMQAVLDRLRDRGVTEVGLEVDAGNTAAIRLYTRFGFRTITTYRYMRLPALAPRATLEQHRPPWRRPG